MIVVSVKTPPKMVKAIKKQADREFTSMSGIIKKAVEEYLLKNGIDWRKEDTPKKSK